MSRRARPPWTSQLERPTDVYYADFAAGVFKIPRAGGVPTTIAALPTARQVAVDQTSVYVTSNDGLDAFPLGGGPGEHLVDGNVGALFLDGDTLYFTEYGGLGGDDTVAKIAIGGGPVTTFAGGLNAGFLTVDEKCIYYAEAGPIQPQVENRGAIHRAPK